MYRIAARVAASQNCISHISLVSNMRRAHSTMSSSIESFHEHLQRSSRILTLIGAGLSASSGLPTFRGKGGMWKNYDATSLATPEAFEADPGLVWQFYAYRRHMALQAMPNPAHFALAELAKKMAEIHGKESVTISQNVDGLSSRAGHPQQYLHLIHGSLFTIRCSKKECDYEERDNLTDPLCPALEVNGLTPNLDDNVGAAAKADHYSAMSLPPAGTSSYTSGIKVKDLPHCPKCDHILRPGVVWFGEPLPGETMSAIDAWVDNGKIDIMLVVGTTAQVYPAAGYIRRARLMGARIAVVNTERHLGAEESMEDDDWIFLGDAGTLVPQLLQPIIRPLAKSEVTS